MRLVPGGEHRGPVTATGHVPVYTANGVQCFVLHVGLFVLCSNEVSKWLLGDELGYYKLSIVYDELGDVINGCNWFALCFVTMLYIKGHVAPTSTDHGSTGNPIFDFYWGMELYPRIFGWDVKVWTNCRFGMMYWAVCTISCGAAAIEHSPDGRLPNSMLTSVVLQLVYITKFFWWETGYFNSIDIMQDRAGFYICWGCLTYIPTMYTSMTVYMVENQGSLSDTGAVFIILAGLFAIWANYDADQMRVSF